MAEVNGLYPIICLGQDWNRKCYNEAFTIIKLKSDLYKLNGIYELIIRDTSMGIFRIEDMKNLKLEQMNNYIAYLDMGIPVDRARAIIEKENIKKTAMPSSADYLLILLVKHYE